MAYSEAMIIDAIIESFEREDIIEYNKKQSAKVVLRTIFGTFKFISSNNTTRFKKKLKKKLKKKTEKKIVVPESKILTQVSETYDEQDVSENESDFEKISVRKLTLEGKDYLMGTDNKIYDCNTQDFIGKFENNTINFDAEDSDIDFSD